MAAPSEKSLAKIGEILGADRLTAKPASGGMINAVWYIHDADRPVAVLKRYNDLRGAGAALSTGSDRARIEVEALSGRLRTHISQGTHLMDAPVSLPPKTTTEHQKVPSDWSLALPRSLGTIEDRPERAHAELYTYFPHDNSLEQALRARGSLQSDRWGEIGAAIGYFFARLHGATANSSSLAHRFSNGAIQRIRRDVQYDQAPRMLCEYAKKFRLAPLEEPELSLPPIAGEHFVEAARCVTMGDAWPRSFLLNTGAGSVGVIDWEFAHYGSPAQDMAHLLTHLWMIGAAHPDNTAARRCAEAIATAYDNALTPELTAAWAEEQRYLTIHGASEIAMRLAGPFSAGYFLAEAPLSVAERAYEKARQLLLAGHDSHDKSRDRSLGRSYSITPFFKMIFA